MQIVIKISEEDKKVIDRLLKGKGLAFLDNAQLIKRVVLAVFHGTPLPKGHGDLIDRDEVEKLEGRLNGCFYDEAETIIEADKEEE